MPNNILPESPFNLIVSECINLHNYILIVQYRGVISMFLICQRNVESMTKQWHTLYGYAVLPEKVSWTSPCRVSSSFSSTIYSSLSTTRPRSGPHSLSPTNLENPSSTSVNGDVYLWWGEGKETVCCCSQRWICALRVSLSFCSYLHCCLNLAGLFRLANMKTDWIRLRT